MAEATKISPFIDSRLIATIDKGLLLRSLRKARENSMDHREADTYGKVIKLVDSGRFDG